jgi:hypothetical protein
MAVQHIKHWRMFNVEYERIPCDWGKDVTWYVDPPYQKTGHFYKYPSTEIDFAKLGSWCRSREGQVIVCENTGADWLPFRHLANVKAMSSSSAQAIWTNDDGT